MQEQPIERLRAALDDALISVLAWAHDEQREQDRRTARLVAELDRVLAETREWAEHGTLVRDRLESELTELLGRMDELATECAQPVETATHAPAPEGSVDRGPRDVGRSASRGGRDEARDGAAA